MKDFDNTYVFKENQRKNIAKIIWKGWDVNMKDDLDVLLEEYMGNSEFQREWENLEPEFNAIQALIDARKSKNMTQRELAQRTGIDQADISKIETGNGNPTLHLLKRLADGMDMVLKLEFIPK